jgi:hypothetical protein
MIKSIHPFDYTLTLSTGECIDIAEIDTEVVPSLNDSDVISALSILLSKCVNITRVSMEETKRGYDRDFRSVFRSPISGLIKNESHICRLRHECSMFAIDTCSTHTIRKNRSMIPICWEYESPTNLSREKQSIVMMIGTVIIQAWRANQIVVIIRN